MSAHALKLKDPGFINRDLENDHILHLKENWDYYSKIALRTSVAALPLIGLYLPKTLSIVGCGFRSRHCYLNLRQDWNNRDRTKIKKSLFECSMAVASVAGTIFLNPLGMFVTSCHDLYLNGDKLYQAIKKLGSANTNTEYAEIFKIIDKELVKLSNNFLFLIAMLYGGIAAKVGSRIMHIAFTAYLAKEDYDKGQNIECGFNLLMVAIKVNHLRPELTKLQKEYKLQSIRQETSKLFLKIASCLTEPLCYIHKIGNLIEPHKNGLDWINKAHPILSSVPTKCFTTAIRTTQVVATVPAILLAGVGEGFRISGSILQTEGFCHRRGNGLEKAYIKQDPIKVMTFNVCGIGAGYEITNGNQVSWDLRVDAIIDEIEKSDPDVVCLQEVFDSSLGDHLFERLKDTYAHFYSDMGTWAFCPSGSMVISKIPGKMNFLSFSSYCGDGFFQNKGFTPFEIYDSVTKNLTLVVASAHLQHDDGPKEAYEKAREGQVKQVTEYFNNLLKKVPDLFCLFTGDLNINKGSKEHTESSLQEWTDPRKYTGNLEADHTWSTQAARQVYDPNITKQQEMLDYILYMGLKPHYMSVDKQSFDQGPEDPTKIPSDHLPLVATIQLESNE